MDKFLIVVDMQNDFITGSLGTKEAQAIVSNVVDRINACRSEGYQIIGTLDTHHENYFETQEGKKLPVKHCIAGTDGWLPPPEINNKFAGSPVFLKPTFGCINLPGYIKETVSNPDDMTIELIGVCTDICVVSNAILLKAYFPEATIQVNASCCAGVTPELHEAALKVMSSCQIEII